MPGVESVRDQVPRRPGTELHPAAELRTRELGYARRALTTESDTALTTRSGGIELGRQLVAAHLVGEQRRELEALCLGLDARDVQRLDPVQGRLDTLVLQPPPHRHVRAHDKNARRGDRHKPMLGPPLIS